MKEFVPEKAMQPLSGEKYFWSTLTADGSRGKNSEKFPDISPMKKLTARAR